MASRAMYRAIVAISVASLPAARYATLASPASSNAATSAEITAQSLGGGSEVFGAPSVESDSHRTELDLLGNEVEHAIADYRIDRGGGVYERHSPETAIERLGSPST